MWSLLQPCLPARARLAPEIGSNITDLSALYSNIKTVKKEIVAQDANKDGLITGSELKKVDKELKDNLQLLEKHKDIPEVATALKVLDKVKSGQPLTKDDLIALDGAATKIKQRMSELVKGETTTLTDKEQTSLLGCVGAKPYLQSQITALRTTMGVDGSNNVQLLETFLNGLKPPEKANGIRSELSKDMAMDKLRGSYMTDPKYQAGYQMLNLNTDPTRPSSFVAANFNPSAKDLADPKKVETMKQALLHHPDVALAEKIAALQKLGVTDIKDCNKLIEASRKDAIKEIDKEGAKFYKALGGGGQPPRTQVLSTGDGTGTIGLKGMNNACVAFFEYGAPTRIARSSPTNSWQEAQGIGTRAVTYPIDDPTQPTPIHLSGVGANNPLSQANTVTIEQKDAKGVMKTYTLNVYQENSQTKMGIASGSATPPGWDPSTQSFTLPPSPNPVSIKQQSTSGDEFQVTASVFNTKPEKLELDLSDVFKPNQFVPAIKPGSQVDQDVKAIAAYIKKHPEAQFPTSMTGMGAVTMKDGERKPTSDFLPGTGYSGDNTADKLKSCRYSGLDIDFTTNQISIVSSTDPVRATISVKDAVNTTPELNKQIKEFRDANPGKTLTDNQILSGLRAFAILDAVQKELGTTPDMLTKAKVNIGDGVQMNYDQYVKMRDAAPKPN